MRINNSWIRATTLITILVIISLFIALFNGITLYNLHFGGVSIKKIFIKVEQGFILKVDGIKIIPSSQPPSSSTKSINFNLKLLKVINLLQEVSVQNLEIEGQRYSLNYRQGKWTLKTPIGRGEGEIKFGKYGVVLVLKQFQTPFFKIGQSGVWITQSKKGNIKWEGYLTIGNGISKFSGKIYPKRIVGNFWLNFQNFSASGIRFKNWTDLNCTFEYKLNSSLPTLQLTFQQGSTQIGGIEIGIKGAQLLLQSKGIFRFLADKIELKGPSFQINRIVAHQIKGKFHLFRLVGDLKIAQVDWKLTQTNGLIPSGKLTGIGAGMDLPTSTFYLQLHQGKIKIKGKFTGNVELNGIGVVGDWNKTQLIGMVNQIFAKSGNNQISISKTGIGYLPDTNISYLSTGEVNFSIGKEIVGSSSGLTATYTGQNFAQIIDKVGFTAKDVAIALQIPDYPITLYTSLIYGIPKRIETAPVHFTLWGLEGEATPVKLELSQNRIDLKRLILNGVEVGPITFTFFNREGILKFESEAQLKTALLEVLKKGYQITLPLFQQKGNNRLIGKVKIPFTDGLVQLKVVEEIKNGFFQLSNLPLKLTHLWAEITEKGVSFRLKKGELGLPGGGKIGFDGNGTFPFSQNRLTVNGKLSVIYLPFIRMEQLPEQIGVDFQQQQVKFKNLHIQINLPQGEVVANLLPTLYLTPFSPIVEKGRVKIGYLNGIVIFPTLYLTFPFLANYSNPYFINGKIKIDGNRVSIQTPFLKSLISPTRLDLSISKVELNLTALPKIYLQFRKKIKIIDSNITLPSPLNYFKLPKVRRQVKIPFNRSPILPFLLEKKEIVPTYPHSHLPQAQRNPIGKITPPPFPFLNYHLPTVPDKYWNDRELSENRSQKGKSDNPSSTSTTQSVHPTHRHNPIQTSFQLKNRPISHRPKQLSTSPKPNWQSPLANLTRSLSFTFSDVTFIYHRYRLPIESGKILLKPNWGKISINNWFKGEIRDKNINFTISHLQIPVDDLKGIVTQLKRDLKIPTSTPTPSPGQFDFRIPKLPVNLHGKILDLKVIVGERTLPIRTGEVEYFNGALRHLHLSLWNKMEVEGYQQNRYLLFRGGVLTNPLFEKLTGTKGVFAKLNLKVGGVITPDNSLLLNIHLYDTIVEKMKLLNNIIALINLVPSILSFQATGFSAKGYKIKDGKVTLLLYRNFIHITKGTIKGKNNNLNFQFHGYIYPFRKELNLKIKAIINLKIKNIPIVGKLVSYILFGKRGALTIDIQVKGDLENPNVSLSTMEDIATSPLQIMSHIATLPLYLMGIYHPSQNEELQ